MDTRTEQDLQAAISYLGARQNPDDAGEYIYRDDATCTDWTNGEDDLIDLGRDLRAGRADAYSFWCAEHPARQL